MQVRFWRFKFTELWVVDVLVFAAGIMDLYGWILVDIGIYTPIITVVG